jgi:hypothetical protein
MKSIILRTDSEEEDLNYKIQEISDNNPIDAILL